MSTAKICAVSHILTYVLALHQFEFLYFFCLEYETELGDLIFQLSGAFFDMYIGDVPVCEQTKKEIGMNAANIIRKC